MKGRTVMLALGLAIAATAATLAEAAAQSVFSTRGLGFPIEPQDARSQGLGGVGPGLGVGEISWLSPGGFAGLLAPGVVVSYQYDDFLAQAADDEYSGSTARFPLVLAGFPVGDRAVLFAGYGSYLDQNWRLEQSDTLSVADEQVPVTDLFLSEGGVARLRLGGAYSVGQGLGVGLAVDAYTGSIQRTWGRLFPNEAVPTCCRATWTYGGLGFAAGAHWSPTEDTGLALSASYGGTLEATPGDSISATATYDLPLLVRAGASGRIAQNALVAVGGSWDGWSTLDDALAAEGGARDSWMAHGGIEWDGITFRDRPIPVRLGVRTGSLPFRWRADQSADFASESAFTSGLGLVLAGGAVRSDFALELGSRGGDAAGIDESFWRFSLSVRVLGR